MTYLPKSSSWKKWAPNLTPKICIERYSSRPVWLWLNLFSGLGGLKKIVRAFVSLSRYRILASFLDDILNLTQKLLVPTYCQVSAHPVTRHTSVQKLGSQGRRPRLQIQTDRKRHNLSKVVLTSERRWDFLRCILTLLHCDLNSHLTIHCAKRGWDWGGGRHVGWIEWQPRD